MEGESYWWPYLALLPREFTTPLHFDCSALAMLQSTTVFPEIAKLYQSIGRQFMHIKQLLTGSPADTAFTWPRFLWAVSVVMTRQNQIVASSMTDAEPILALIPLWDLCNHRDGEITTFYDPARQESQSYAMADTAAGSELCISYGSRPNSDLLLHSGFVDPDNSSDYIKLSVPLAINGASSELIVIRAKLVEKLCGGGSIKDAGQTAVLRCYPTFIADQRNRPMLLGLALVLTCTEDETRLLAADDTERLPKWSAEQSPVASDSIVKWLRLKLTVLSRYVQ
jgi:hypothetical protein